ncbi:helicase HerA domain-containing protein [Novosphingobium cyanobacteriorum]|uniref:ATP-binding protein n=1 Tax=Novosphingobium cyanobacteriorum TaxID=3024215 RepID=A0ABT6CIX1_9SPHN|nr:ATP-binding protein [Novosphingobium cyanobacteriorum]MDF8333865.1 ATP-binding protein [Novosphingobium cyanobacteriorum]
MSASIVIGTDRSGVPVKVDIEELLATRLLVQGNSGSGKSHLLRRLLEESASLVQQVVIDPEGDFVTLAEPFGHVVVDGSAYDQAEIAKLAARIRTHRASVVLALDGLDLEAQMRCAAVFLNTLFDAPRDEWYPALVVVDEAQMFAPAAAGDVSDEVRRLSLAAMTNLMCRGRKRGLAGVIATQRLAKLAKNVAAEASNFLMGRTFLDIDMARAADLLGMERRQAEAIRDLERGHFLGLGPAIARRPVGVRIADVQTRARNVVQGLMPLPSAAGSDMESLLLAEPLAMEPVRRPEPEPAVVLEADELLEQIESTVPAAEQVEPPTEPSLFQQEETASQVAAILAEMAAEPDCTFQQAAQLFQDFTVRCRMARIANTGIDLAAFRRRFAMAVAGIPDESDLRWRDVLRIAAQVPDDLLAPFLTLAVAATEGMPCPDDDALATIYGTRSPGRIRRLLDHLERSGLIVVRTDYGGRRSVGIPELGLTTAPVAA